MPKFKKKPVVIEAVQWFPPGHEKHDPSMLKTDHKNIKLGDLYKKTFDKSLLSYLNESQDYHCYVIATLEGEMVVSPGDWVITGVEGEKYACKPAIFEKTYEPV